MELKPGLKLHSAVCTTDVIVIRGSGEAVITCGGVELAVDRGPATADPDAALAGGTAPGKRYQTADGSIELLCTKAGKGTLAIDGVPLEIKTAKPLPSSD